MSPFARWLMAAVAVCAVTGCAKLEPPVNNEGAFRPVKADPPPKNVRGFDDDEAVVTIPVPAITLHPIMVDIPGEAAPWPDVNIGIANIRAGLTLQDGIDLAIAEAKHAGWKGEIGLVIRDDDVARRPLNRMRSVSGSFHEIVSRMAENVGGQTLWYQGAIEIARDARFIVPLPPIYDDKDKESVASQIEQLIGAGSGGGQSGGKTVQVDKGSRTIIFRANAEQQRRVENFLAGLRGRALLVYEYYLWDVTLNDATEWGINWSQLGKVSNLTAATDSGITSLAGGMSLMGAFKIPNINISALGSFLRSQGRTRNVINTTLQIVAGTDGEYTNGGTQRIITGVGQQAVATGITTTTLPTTTTNEDIPYGTTLKVAGDVYGDTVWGQIHLLNQNIVALNPTTVDGIEVDRPNRGKDEFKATVRGRPGDTILLGATHNNNQTNQTKGPIGVGNNVPMPSDDNRAEVVEEFVMAIKIRMVRFAYGDEGAALLTQGKREGSEKPAAVVEAPKAQPVAVPVVGPAPAAVPAVVAPVAVSAAAAPAVVAGQPGAAEQPQRVAPVIVPTVEVPKRAVDTAGEKARVPEVGGAADTAHGPAATKEAKKGDVSVAAGPSGAAKAVTRWRAAAGSEMRNVLTVWCESAGKVVCQGIVWNATGSYTLTHEAVFPGSFAGAVARVVKVFANTQRPPSMTIAADGSIIISDTARAGQAPHSARRQKAMGAPVHPKLVWLEEE